jgi:hypothetical protein
MAQVARDAHRYKTFASIRVMARYFKMKRQLFILTVFLTLTTFTGSGQTTSTDAELIVKIEMNLSAFGVESDDFPSIDVVIDFINETSSCEKSYYNPAYKGSTYSLSKTELKDMLNLLKISDLQKLKPEYKVAMSDQPSSKAIIYTTTAKYIINDYGLKGDFPLQELYKIVYKL